MARERLSTEERRQQLLEVGRGLFLERPYDQVSMDDVAQRAGVSKGLIFHYFSTKRDLYLEVVKRAAAELVDATYVAEDRPPLERLTVGLERYLDFVEQNEKGYAALLTSGVGVDPEVFAVVEGVRRTLAERMLAALPSLGLPDAEIAVRGTLGFVEAASLAWLEKRTMSRDELVQLSVKTLIAALGLPIMVSDASVIRRR